MKLIYLKGILVIMIFISCSTYHYKLVLGEELPSDLVKSDDKLFMPSGEVVSCAELFNESFKFTVGITNNHKIIFISTVDSTFVIDGISVHCKLSQIAPNKEIKLVRGWGYYIPVNDKWYAAFDFNQTPNEDSQIQFLFQYDFKLK